MYEPRDGGLDEALLQETKGGVLGKTVRNAAVLLIAGLLVAWGMSNVEEADEEGSEPAAELDRGGPDPRAHRLQRGASGDELVVPPGPNGHFLVDATVNGVAVRFLVDTGASAVTLTAEDARRLGLRPDSLDYTTRFQTANGEILTAPVTLREIRIGDLELEDVPSTVTRAPLGVSLLGMTFLTRLAGYEVGEEGLTLRW